MFFLALFLEITTAALGFKKGGTECQEVFWEAVPDGERSDTGVPGFPENLKYSSGRSGKGGPAGSLWTSRGTPQICLGGGKAQRFPIIQIEMFC